MRRVIRQRLCLAALGLLGFGHATLFGAGPRLEMDWPTPNPAWIEGRPRADFLQATVSGDPASGAFGCVRDDGRQFHEGIDLKPVARDAGGEPADKVFAFLPGVVRYVNDKTGTSNYGRYLVLEHPGAEPAIYTLYAHLRSIAPGIAAGSNVTRGQFIALMGRSEGATVIPKERAHLHFEMGLRVSDTFQQWYDRQKFGSPNEHGLWNGMNLMGFDPLDFLDKFRAHQVDNFQDYFAQLKPAVRVRVATRVTPDFARRYPTLVAPAAGDGLLVAAPAGWEVACNWTALPIKLTPLAAADVVGFKPDELRIVDEDAAALAACHCKSIVITRAGTKRPGKDLEEVLQQLFGL
jgi:hypothetical protein